MNQNKVQDIREQLLARGFSREGDSGLYIKKNEKPVGTLIVNTKSRMAVFHDGHEKFENHSDVPELAEVKALLQGISNNLGQALKEAAALQPRKEKEAPQPAKNQAMVPAQNNSPAVKKDFMHEIQGLPKELVIELGVGDKKKKYALNHGLWGAFYALGLKLKSCKVIHDHWSWQKTKDSDGEEDPRRGEAWVRCEIIVDDGSPAGQYYEAWGDATKENVKLEDVKLALDRMAETRSIDRCLRMITAGGWRIPENNLLAREQTINVIKQCESCAAEELPGYNGGI